MSAETMIGFPRHGATRGSCHHIHTRTSSENAVYMPYPRTRHNIHTRTCCQNAAYTSYPPQGLDKTRAKEVLPWAHTTFGNLKTWLRGTFHGVSGKHLQLYLDEFSYRFDRRWVEDRLGGFILRLAARAEPLPYCRLVAEPVG